MRARTLSHAANALLLVVGLLAGRGTAQAEPLNGVVLQVNDRIATLRDYQIRLKDRLGSIEQTESLGADQRATARANAPRDTLRQMFEEMLLESRADQLNVRVSESELEAALEQIREANNIATKEEFARLVAQSGQTMEGLRQQISRQQRFQEVVGREVYSKVTVEEDDLRIFYRDHPEIFQVAEERQLREVVVLDAGPGTGDDKQRLALDIQRRLSAGEDPASFVPALKDAGSTSAVIELGWVPKGDLDPNLEAAVASLKVGAASAPVAARGGLHVIQLLDRHEETLLPFDQVKEQIHNRERERLVAKQMPKYMKELEAKSFIVANPPPGAELFRQSAGPTDDDPLEAFRKAAAEAEAAEKKDSAKPAAASPPR